MSFRCFYRIIFPALLLAGSLGVFNSIALSETLSEAVSLSLANHPAVKAAKYNEGALEAGAREARSGLFPDLNITGTGGRNYADNSTSRGLSVTRGAGYSWLWEGSVTLSQHLFDGFETEKQIDAAAARRTSAAYEVRDVRENMALQTAIAFLDVLRTDEAMQKLLSHRNRLDSYLSRIREMVDEGGADASMLARASDIRAQLENAIVNMNGELQTALATYSEIVGRRPQTKLLKPAPQTDLVPSEVKEAVTFAHDNHPAIKATDLSRKALIHEVEAEKSSLFPDFTGELSYYKRDQDDLIGGEVIDAKAVVRMNWDYSLGGAYQARVRRSLQREAETRAQLAEIKRRIAREIEIAYSERDTASGQIRIQKQRVSLNKDLLSTYEDQFEAGRVNILQIMQADNTLFNSQMALLNGEYRLLASHYAVLASMGRLQQALDIAPDPMNDRTEE